MPLFPTNKTSQLMRTSLPYVTRCIGYAGYITYAIGYTKVYTKSIYNYA